MEFANLFVQFLFDQWAICYPCVIGFMIIFYLIFLVFRNPGLVDFAWEANHLLVGVVQLLLQYRYNNWKEVNVRAIVYLSLLFIWFLRLGGYILITRIIPGEKDPRYEKLVADQKNPLVFFFIQYEFQGLLISITSIPLFWDMIIVELTWSFYVGVIVVLIGIIGEAVSDYQLYAYKKNQKAQRELNSQAELIGVQKKIFAEGLWKKSRHPNLFFELITWIGFAIGGIYGWLSLVGFVGPIFLFIIMKYVTVPISEQYMRDTRKEQYDEFCRTTNMFFIF